MLSSNALSDVIPDALWRRYADLETDMILVFAERARSEGFIELWSTNRAQAESILRSDLEALINSNFPDIKKELSNTISLVGNKTLHADEVHFLRGVSAGALPSIGPLSESVAISNILTTAYGRALNSLNVTNTTAINTVTRQFDDMVLRAVSGNISIDAAIRTSVNEFAAQGVRVARYSGGREMELSSYTRMIIRTEAIAVATDLAFARADEYGNDLIQISAHAGARPRCFPYQGRVYSRNGNSERYPALSSTSYGEPAGIFGINCSHFPTPFIDGVDREMTAEERDPAQTHLEKSNDQVYRESQKQRANERQIRMWKRRAKALDEAGIDNTKAKQMIKAAQARQRAFIERTNRTRRYSREAA